LKRAGWGMGTKPWFVFFSIANANRCHYVYLSRICEAFV
jgi:hypothetical protein